MKKYIGLLVILSLFTFGASKAQAVSMSDLQKQIKSLNEQISLLKGQLIGTAVNSIANTTTVSNVANIAPSINIQKGTTSAEVSALQQALKEKGYFTGNVTSYYGDVTAKAVSSYQKAMGLPVTGIVDTATKNSIGPSPTPVSPVSGLFEYQIITSPFVRLNINDIVKANMYCPQGKKALTAGYILKYNQVIMVGTNQTLLTENFPASDLSKWILQFVDPQHLIATQDNDPINYSKGYLVCATF
jgi:peptidoglycan hydrolase-like protein with peptidoglycan-binding domain